MQYVRKYNEILLI